MRTWRWQLNRGGNFKVHTETVKENFMTSKWDENNLGERLHWLCVSCTFPTFLYFLNISEKKQFSEKSECP